MTRIRFMKERARNIICNNDPMFRVIRSEQRELSKGLYLFSTLIRESGTGKVYKVCYTAGVKVKGWKKLPIRPFDFEEPLFSEEVDDGEKGLACQRFGILPVMMCSRQSPDGLVESVLSQ